MLGHEISIGSRKKKMSVFFLHVVCGNLGGREEVGVAIPNSMGRGREGGGL